MILFKATIVSDCHLSLVTYRRNVRGRFLLLAGLIVSLLAVFPAQCNSQDRRPTVVEQRVERSLREYSHKSGAAGIAFGMVQGSSTLVECYAGYASRISDKRVDSSSVFHWASMSKGLTAVCALKMAENGQLNLDANIKHYIPELELQRLTTLRQLLCHQGGIGGYDKYPELFELMNLDQKSITQQAILVRMTGKEHVFLPGGSLGYSSPGYILLSIAMERASKKSFSEIVDEMVAKPLKLSSLRVGGSSEADVQGYRLVNGERQPIENLNNNWRLGAGAVKSNLSDALVFASCLIQSSVLTPASSRELFKRRALAKSEGHGQGSTVGFTYGFNRVGLEPDAPISVIGMQPGARSLMIIFPREQLASVIFANTTPLDIEGIQRAVMEAASKK